MPYFPFFANIENMPCLVVGGGQVALRKIEKLLDFSPIIKVVASKACGEIKKLAKRGMITLFERAFKDSDIDGSTFVITATGDSGVNRHISQLCRQRHIPCNAVDDPESCTFFFPAIITEGGRVHWHFNRRKKPYPCFSSEKDDPIADRGQAWGYMQCHGKSP